MADTRPLYVFRADAGIHLGVGHVMRCLALADVCKKNGGDVLFICRPHPGHLHDLIQRYGHEVSLLPTLSSGTSDGDAEQTISLIQHLCPQWIVVDHYGIGASWHDEVQPYAEKIMVIDDLAQGAFHCDLLLNQNLGCTQSNYADKVPAECTLLLGAQYALLKSEFADLRPQALAKRRNCQNVQKVFLSVGGMDPNNLIGKILDSLSKSDDFNAEVIVALSSQSPNVNVLSSQIQALPFPAMLHLDAGNVAQLMLDSDCAIGAAGSSSWERCCLGLPSIVLVVADNQIGIAQALADKEAAKVIHTPADISDYINWGCDYLTYAENAARICDGEGVNRVADVLFSD